jgi:hypothetical protein
VRALCWLYSSTGPVLASGSLDATIRLWEIVDHSIVDHSTSTLSRMHQVEVLAEHDGSVNAIVQLPTQEGQQERQLFASSSADKSIILWDLPTRRVVARQEEGHELGVCALAAFAERPWIASGSADTTVKLWQVPDASASTLELLLTMRGHTGPVHALVALEAEGWLASGSADSTVRLWRVDEDASSGENLARDVAGAPEPEPPLKTPDDLTLGQGAATPSTGMPTPRRSREPDTETEGSADITSVDTTAKSVSESEVEELGTDTNADEKEMREQARLLDGDETRESTPVAPASDPGLSLPGAVIEGPDIEGPPEWF